MALEGPGETKSWLDAQERAMQDLVNTGRDEEAERHARAFLSRFDEDAKGALRAYLHRRASAYEVLAVVAVLRGNMPEAFDLVDRGLESLRSPPVHDQAEASYCALESAQLLRKRALLFLQTGDLDAAKAALERHILALSTLGQDLTPEMQLALVDSHIRWADILKEQNDLDNAEDLLQRAVQVARECAARHSQDDRWQLEILRSLAALGRLQFYKRDVDSALEILVPAAALAERLEGRGPSSELWRDVLDAFYFDLGFALSQELRYSKRSDRIREQALSWIRRQLERAPDDVRLGWWLARFYLDRVLLLMMEDITGAKDAARQALELAAKLPVEEEEDAALKRRIEALRAFVPKKPQRPRRAKR